MKKVFLSIVTIITLSSCKEQNVIGPMILSGTIENPKSDSISIFDMTDKVVHTIKLADHNNFADTFSIAKGYYYLSQGYNRTNLFLKPSINLLLEINAESFDESIVYKGKGSNENNFLAKNRLFENNLWKLNEYNRNEDNFLKLLDSLYTIRVNRLKSNQTKFDKDFVSYELNKYKLKKLWDIALYEHMHQSVTKNKDFKVTTHFPDPYKSLDFNNEQLLMSSDYLALINHCIGKEVNDKVTNNDSVDCGLGIVNIVENKIKNLRIREILYSQHLEEILGTTKDLDKVYEKLTSFIGDEKLLRELKIKYEKLKKIQKGNISPDFSFYDINNQLVTLGSLKGKIIYIDVWATWCSPCMAEFPALKHLEEDFKNKNIQFVSISKDENKERWLQTVKEKELVGIQICANSDSSKFYDDFSVFWIPRFIILDRNGYIIDPNAKRPSNPKLKEELLTLLQN